MPKPNPKVWPGGWKAAGAFCSLPAPPGPRWTVCAALAEEFPGLALTERFSPGFGDLPLELQRQVTEALDCPRSLGITLGESLLMTPSKSVTAIIGMKARDPV